MQHFRAELTPKEEFVFNMHRGARDESHPQIDYREKVCVKPWGFEFLAFENAYIAVWIMHIRKGHATSLHCHFKKDTHFIVIDGAAKVTLAGGKELCVSCMSSVFIPRYAFHGAAALSPECVILEIEVYHTDCITWSDKNDLLRLSDPYKRQNTGYEASVEIDTNMDKYDAFYIDGTTHNHAGCIVAHTKISTRNEQPPNYMVLSEGALCDGQKILAPGSMVTIDDVATRGFAELRETRALLISRPNYQEDAKIVYDLEHLILLTQQNFVGKRVILTSGCFDIVHAGHVTSLREAKRLGDFLVVCLSNDSQVKALKGEGRPINDLASRCDLIKAIPYVDYIVLYDEVNIEQEETLDHIMRILDPFSWVKGDEYNEADIRQRHPHLSRIDLLKMKPGQSTTHIISKVMSKQQ